MRLVIFSDTHTCHRFLNMPEGDMLIFAGDMCGYGRGKEARDFIAWMEGLPYEHKVAICGNHDWPFYKDTSFGRREFDKVHYLQDSSVTINGIKIYGSPWQPEFNDWAFNLPRGEKLAAKWRKIPEDVDILVTHSPPSTVLDSVDGLPMGCSDLHRRVLEITPRFHIFGHIHTQYGVKRRDGLVYVNASIVDDYNVKQNEPITLDYILN